MILQSRKSMFPVIVVLKILSWSYLAMDGRHQHSKYSQPPQEGWSKVFVTDDPEKFNDSNYTGYSHVGNEARTEAYVKSVIFGEGGEIMRCCRRWFYDLFL